MEVNILFKLFLKEILDEIKSLKSKWRSNIGKEAYDKIELMIENDIDRVLTPELYEGESTTFIPTIAFMHEQQNQKGVASNEKSGNKGIGFKKIKIVEEVENEENVNTEGEKIKDFFKKVEEEIKVNNYLGKEGKLKEQCEGNRKVITECKNCMQKLKKDSIYYSKMENIINELNAQINEYNKKEILVRVLYYC